MKNKPIFFVWMPSSSAALFSLTVLTFLRSVVRSRPSRVATCLLETFFDAVGEGRVARMTVWWTSDLISSVGLHNLVLIVLLLVVVPTR